MPNYIKNRIRLEGSQEQINTLLEKFSTHFERKPNLTHDGELIYKNPNTGEYGWLDSAVGKFKRRNLPEANGVPDGFIQEFDEAWTRFPDFKKIVPMAEELEIESGSLGEMAHELLFGGTAKKKFFPLSVAENQKRFREMSVDQQKEAVDLAIKYQQNIEKYGHATWYDWSIENWGTKWNSSECEKVGENEYDFTTAWSGVPDLIEKMSIEFPEVKIYYKYSDEDTGCNCGIGEYKSGEIYFRELENSSKEAYEMAFELRPDRKENYKLVGDNYEYAEED